MPRWSSYDVGKKLFINVKKKLIRMKKQENAYAPMRIGFYENRFQNQTIQQLTDEFNRLARSRGWTAERSFFSVALMNEMLRRGVDVSAVVEREA